MDIISILLIIDTVTSDIARLAASVAEFYLHQLAEDSDDGSDGEDFADDEEIAFLRPYLNIPQLAFNHLNFDHLGAQDSCQLFQFTVHQIKQILELLLLPVMVKTEGRDVVHRCEALAIVLGHLAYPGRLFTLSQLFSQSKASLSRIINHTI